MFRVPLPLALPLLVRMRLLQTLLLASLLPGLEFHEADELKAHRGAVFREKERCCEDMHSSLCRFYDEDRISEIIITQSSVMVSDNAVGCGISIALYDEDRISEILITLSVAGYSRLAADCGLLAVGC